MVQWTFGAVGDVFVNRPDPENAFSGAQDVLRRFDLVFGNCEGAYIDAPTFAPSAGWPVVAPERCGSGLRDAGFHVMALANNHILDAGHEGLARTMRLLASQEIRTVGAGSDLAEARTPCIVERAGVKIGFAGFSSVYQAGYEARRSVPGLAAVRVHSHYYIPEWDAYGKVEPGAVPEVRTFPYPEDMEAMSRIVSDLRERADVVVVSHHWGQSLRRGYLTDYERMLARASVDAGADIVLGHHHHFLRGVEVYREKPIFYGLGHFVFDLPGLERILSNDDIARLREMGEYAIYPREGYPLSPFHPDGRLTMIAVFEFEGSVLKNFGFLPCQIDRRNNARPTVPSSSEWKNIVGYMSEVSRIADIPASYGVRKAPAISAEYVLAGS